LQESKLKQKKKEKNSFLCKARVWWQPLNLGVASVIPFPELEFIPHNKLILE
jgi:hypothetical protein